MSEGIRLRHELETIKSYLVAAQDIVKSGHMPELAGLEVRIAAVCESVKKAEPDVQKICLPELLVLIDHLNTCEKAMREMHAAKSTEGKKP